MERVHFIAITSVCLMFYSAECNFASLLCPKSTRNDDEKLQIEGKKILMKIRKKTDEKNSDEINSNENNQIKKSNKKLMQIKIVPHNFASGKDENCEYLLVFN